MFPKDNPESWQQIYQFIDRFPDDAYWSVWEPMVRKVVVELEKHGLSEFFRIGQGMHQIIFSTLDQHVLESEPRVTLEFSPKEQTMRVAYSYALLYFHEPLSEETVSIDLATQSTINYLRRLWIETKPEIQIPDALNP